MKLTLVEKIRLTDDAVLLRFAAADRGALPIWEPGAHLELELASGLIRQYSLCGRPDDRMRYDIAVLKDSDGRGGSREIHEEMTVGDEIISSDPRNHFPLVEAANYVFVAGGIGITPVKAMVESLAERGASWRLLYRGRSLASMVFAGGLRSAYGGSVELHPSDEVDRPDVEALVASMAADAQLYCCGPPAMIAEVAQVCERAGAAERLHLERFSVDEGASPGTEGGAFDVELARTGATLRVAEDQTILEAIRQVCSDVPSSCQEGYCGTCETAVLAGKPDHRGILMTPEEHDEEGTMLICVGRSKSDKLVLDL